MKFLALADLHYNNSVWKDGYFQSLLKDFIKNNQIDVVLIAGKGHEDYQILKDKTIHFDDREQARKVFAGSVI